MNLRDCVCIVTGGAQGIGEAVCTEILKRNGKVSILDVDEQKGKQSVTKIENEFGPGRAFFIHCDVSSKAQMEGAFQRTFDKFGHIDVVVNNAGIVKLTVLQDLSLLDKMIDINLKGVVLGSHFGVKYMGTSGGKGKGGVIVNVASMAGLNPYLMSPVYSATKHAVVGLSRSLQVLKLQEGIRVNCICPSLVDTPMVCELINTPDVPQQYRDKLKQFEKLKPELIAEGIMQLIEDESKNGAVMQVNKANELDYKIYGS